MRIQIRMLCFRNNQIFSKASKNFIEKLRFISLGIFTEAAGYKNHKQHGAIHPFTRSSSSFPSNSFSMAIAAPSSSLEGAR